jgi:hypothetical protein
VEEAGNTKFYGTSDRNDRQALSVSWRKDGQGLRGSDGERREGPNCNHLNRCLVIALLTFYLSCPYLPIYIILL